MNFLRRNNRQEEAVPDATHESRFEDSALYKRLTTYGTRGIVWVDSPEGASISPEAAQYLRPAGSEYADPDNPGSES